MAIDGPSGVPGLLPADDPLTRRAMRSLRGITRTDAPIADATHPSTSSMASSDQPRLSRSAASVKLDEIAGDTQEPYDAHEWQGIMLDTGANIDAVGALQRMAFTEHAGLDFPIKLLAAEVSTVGGQTTVIGGATTRVPLTSPDIYAEVSFEVLSSTSPMILGLPTINTMGWTVCTKTCTVDIGNGQLRPLVKKNGHLFLFWQDQNEDGEASFAMNDEDGMTTDLRPTRRTEFAHGG